MSKERARRRAERDAKLAAEHRERERRAAAAREKAIAESARRRSGVRGWWATANARQERQARSRTRAEQRRRARLGVIASAFVAVQVGVWLFFPSWYVRVFVLGFSLLLTPVIVTLTTDRKA